MFYKKIILTAVAALGIMAFFGSDYYQGWLDRYIMPEHTKVADQMERMSVEERKEYRFNTLYTLCKYMKNMLDTTSFKAGEPIVLLPPNAYLAAKCQQMPHLAEPAEIYYHCGIKSVWTTSPDAQKANWAIVVTQDGGIAFTPLRTKEQRDQLLNLYKDYKPAL